jgi:tetratricopeptide (TPR) repeat protein
MAFQGDLGNINLASVFQNLAQNRVTGTLIVRRGKEERYIYFREGQITMFSEGAGEEAPLPGLLVRLGVVEKGEMDKALKKRKGRTSLSQVLSKMGLAEETQILQAIRTFVYEEIYDLFTWGEGTFDFKEGQAVEGVFDPEIAAADLSIDVNEVILEAARRQDEWDRIRKHVGSQKDIYALRKEREEEAKAITEAPVPQVLQYIDGRRTVEAIITESGLGRYTVCKVLADLIAKRLLRQLSVAEVQKEAHAAIMEGRLSDADALLDRALEIEHGNIAARRLSGEVKEKLGKTEAAAQEYKIAAGLLIESGEAAGAAECLRDTVRLQPHDLAARERLYHLLKEMNKGREARAVALEAAGFCMRMGVYDRAAALLENLVAAFGSDGDTDRMLVEVYVGQGKVDKAVGIYQQRAQAAMKKGAFPVAQRIYEEILKLQPSNDEARRRIAEINSGALERRRRRRRYLYRGIFITLVVAALFAWQAFEITGRRTLERELLPKVEAALLEGQYITARGLLVKFQEGSFGWTRAGDDARFILRVMQMMRAQRLYQEAEALQNAGDVKGAEEKYREVYSMGCPAAFQEKVEKRLAEITGRKE